MIDLLSLTSYLDEMDKAFFDSHYSGKYIGNIKKKSLLSYPLRFKNLDKKSKFFVFGCHTDKYFKFYDDFDVSYIGSYKEWLLSRSKKCGFFNIRALFFETYRVLARPTRGVFRLEDELAKLEFFFRDNSKGNSYLVVYSDVLPIYRLVIAAAKRAGLKVVCFQHGLFPNDIKISEIDGSRSDINIVRTMNQKLILEEKGAQDSNIIVYPDFFYGNSKSKNRLVLIGEGYSILSSTLDDVVFSEYSNLYALLSPSCDIMYRPHPSELNFIGLIKTSIKRKLPNGIKVVYDDLPINGDIYVGISSSYLVDAYYSGLDVVQLDTNTRFFPNRKLDCENLKVLKINQLIDYVSKIEYGIDKGIVMSLLEED